jgi:hypothetical protein
MQSKYFNPLLIPVLFLLLTGVGSFYGYTKFDAHIPIEQSKFAKLQVAMQSVNCQAINKDALLSIARGKLENTQTFAEILLGASQIFILIGIMNFAVIYKYLKPKVHSTN